MTLRFPGFAAFALALALLSCSKPEIAVETLQQTASQSRDEFYLNEVRPVLDSRCVSCHACYTSPCQLNLADHEGIRRGASKIKLYEGSRLAEIEPTRLHEDAKSAPEWWKKGFHPVVHEGDKSMFLTMIEQRRKNLSAVRETVKESATCAEDADELEDFHEDYPEKGMPYGLPALTETEAAVLHRWLAQGFPTLTPALRSAMNQPSEADRNAVDRWEALLNQNDAKSKLIARYIYEHIFLAAVEFSDQSSVPMKSGPVFYRLVRSRTAAPQPIDFIATRRVFDDPGPTFSYRFQRIAQTITHKNHMILTLDQKKWDRYQQLFYRNPFSVTTLPDYKRATSANPFLVFQQIPAASRYQFLLDNSRFFVSAFIKGTVCEGETAVNVIQERFFVFFLDPRSDKSVQSDSYIAHVAKDLRLPSQEGIIDNFYGSYKSSQMDFVKVRQKAFAELYPQGLKLSDVWDGDGTNPEAVLTVFRHNDNSYVQKGAIGALPKTAWVMDYPIFERMYYLLVAGFDVFGNVVHQLSTRLYMDNLRVESEDIFLSFLPSADRATLRDFWYRGGWAKKKMEWLNPFGGVPSEPAILYSTPDRKRELIEKILFERLTPEVRGPVDLKSCCGYGTREDVREALSPLTNQTGGFTRWFPDVTLLLVESGPHEDEVYSLVHDKAHYNVSFLLNEEERLAPNEDSLSIHRGVYGSFPNFYLRVKEEDLAQFVHDTIAIEEGRGAAFERWVNTYGISRNRGDFWTYADRIQAWFDEDKKSRGGILDLSKYKLW